MSNKPKELVDEEMPGQIAASEGQELLSLDEATRKMAALITLDKARGQPLFEAKVHELILQLGLEEKITSIPMLMENPDYVSQYHDGISKIFPDIWKEVHDPSVLDNAGKQLLAEAGHVGLNKRKGVGELNRFVGMLDTYDQQFGTGGNTLAHLKTPAAKEWIQGGLKMASWGVSIVTGGIYVKAGLAAAGYLVGKLGANEKVRDACRDLSNQAYARVSKMTGIDEAKLRSKAEAAKRVMSNKWVLAGAAVCVGVAAALALGEFKIEMPEANASALPEANHGAVPEANPSGENGLAERAGADGAPSEQEEIVRRIMSDKLSPAQMDEMKNIADAATIDLPVSSAAAVTEATVKQGDSLWKIAEAHLEQSGGQASNKEISELVDRIYESNKDVIGSNRDLIMPGQELKIDLAPPVSVSTPDSQIASDAFKPDFSLSNTGGLVSNTNLGAIIENSNPPQMGKFDFSLASTAVVKEEKPLDYILNDTLSQKDMEINVRSVKYRDIEDPSLG